MPRTEHSSSTSASSLPPSYGSQISLIAYTHPLRPPSATFHRAPGQSRGRMAAGGPWESGLGWGPLTNTHNVLIDPMPSYFRTSARRQWAARRDRQSAVLKELEQGWGEEEEWMEGGGSGGFTALYRGGQQEGRGHKFNCAAQNDGIRKGGGADV